MIARIATFVPMTADIEIEARRNLLEPCFIVLGQTPTRLTEEFPLLPIVLQAVPLVRVVNAVYCRRIWINLAVLAR